MKSKIVLLSLATLMFALPSLAWNCTQSGQVRVQVPTGTKGTGTGDGPGQVVVDSGLTFQCQTLPQPSTPVSGNTQSQTQSTASSSNAASNAASTSNSTSGVKNSGNSTNTLSNSLKNSGNSNSTSSLSNSGNSSSTNSQSLTNPGNSSASNNGNQNNSTYANSTKVEAAANTAFSTALPTAPCVIGYGAGGQALLGGFSFSGGKVDKNCADLEAARSLAVYGSQLAYCKVVLQNKYVKQAGVTLEDCLQRQTVAVVPTPAPIIGIPTPQPIVIQLPQPVAAPVEAPAITVNETTQLRELPSCNIYSGITNVCKRIADDALLALNQNPNTSLIISGPAAGSAIILYLRSRGLDVSRVRMKFLDDQNSTLNFELYTVSHE